MAEQQKPADGEKQGEAVKQFKLEVIYPARPEEYELQDVIGVGATAVVHLGFCKTTQERVAIKRIHLEKSSTSIEELMKEVQVMRTCQHENIAGALQCFIVGEEIFVIMRVMSCGSLLDIIKSQLKKGQGKTGVLEEATIATVMFKVLKGLEYIHKNGHIHRDIKAGNILLHEDGTVQLGDFGVSAFCATGGDLARSKSRHTFVGTPCWMAPEVMEQVKGYNQKADIWSFGITAIELATGTAPYHKYPPMKVLMLTLQNDPPTLETGCEDKDQYKNYGKTFRKMISDCLQKDPDKRPTVQELMKHPFFKKAKDRKYLVQTLVPLAPGIHHRSSRATQKHKKPASGRLHRNEDGTWDWSSGDEGAGGGGWSDSGSSSDGDGGKEATKDGKKLESIQEQNTVQEAGGKKKMNEQQQMTDVSKQAEGLAQVEITPQANSGTTSLILRLRNSKRELNDIRFDFTVGKDTPPGIAQELVGAGLVDATDMILIASNLQKLLDMAEPSKGLTFGLNSGCAPNEMPDDKALIGFAQLKIDDGQVPADS